MVDEEKYGDNVSTDEEISPDDDFEDFCSDTEGFNASESGHHSEDEKPPTESKVLKDTPSTDMPSSSSPQDGTSSVDADFFIKTNEKLESIAGTEQRLFAEVREMHKLYHSEFAGRLKSMQDELEQYRKIDKGKVFDDILASLARIYGNNETLADEVAEPKAKKSIRYMLMDIEDLLGVYGMAKLRSEVGEKRNPRHCQILNRIPTNDSAKHDTVAKSYNSGFYIGNRTVIKEVVDIFFYEGQPIEDAEKDNIIETGDIPVKE